MQTRGQRPETACCQEAAASEGARWCCDLTLLARNEQTWQAAKGLSAADLQLLLNRAEGANVS